MKNNKIFYLSIVFVFLTFLSIQVFSFAQIDTVYIQDFDIRSLLYIPYTLGIILLTTVFIYILPIVFFVELSTLFIYIRKSYIVKFTYIEYVNQMINEFYSTLSQQNLQVIRCWFFVFLRHQNTKGEKQLEIEKYLFMQY